LREDTAFVARIGDQVDLAAPGGGHVACHREAVIGGGIVEQDHLGDGMGLGEDAGEALRQVAGVVVGGHD